MNCQSMNYTQYRIMNFIITFKSILKNTHQFKVNEPNLNHKSEYVS